MRYKRHTQRQAAALLARIVDFVYDTKTTAAHQRALRELEQADFGFKVWAERIGGVDDTLKTEPGLINGTLRADWRRYLDEWFSQSTEPHFIDTDMLKFSTQREGKAITVSISGDPQHVLLFQLVNLLRAAGADRLRTCEACEQPFVRQGRKRFCSERCQKRIFMREWRKQ